MSQTNYWKPVAALPNAIASGMLADSLGWIYATSFGYGVYRSTDGGASWHAANNGFGSTYVYGVEARFGGELFAGTADGLYRSANQGGSWSLANNFWHAMSVGFNSKTGIFVGWEQDYNVGIFSMSTDNGATWTDSRLAHDPDIYSLAVDSKDNIFAGTAIGVFRSTTGGMTWDSVSPGTSGQSVWVVEADGNDNLFAGTWLGGVFRSTNGGASWLQVGIIGGDVRAMAVNSNNYIFVASWHQGIFRSTDSGSTWSDFSGGLTNTAVQALAIDPEGFLYATGDSGTVFKSIYSTTSVSAPSQSFPTRITIDQNYPNPFNPKTTLGFELPENATISLVIYDILGREVVTLARGIYQGGQHSLIWDAGSSASGVYYARFTAADESGKVKYSKVNKLLLMK